MSGKRKLNPLELSDKFVEKLKNEIAVYIKAAQKREEALDKNNQKMKDKIAELKKGCVDNG